MFERIRGDSLSELMYNKRQPLTALEMCTTAYDIINALHYLHAQLIVHNYINAQSVYCLETKAVLGGFQHSQDTRMEQAPISSITSQLPWMAPAQAEGALPDTASDIYRYDNHSHRLHAYEFKSCYSFSKKLKI